MIGFLIEKMIWGGGGLSHRCSEEVGLSDV